MFVDSPAAHTREPTIRRSKCQARRMRMARSGTMFLDATPEIAERIRALIKLIHEANADPIDDAEVIANVLEIYVQSRELSHHRSGLIDHDRPLDDRPALTTSIDEKGSQSWA
jgi:hypothetical protein